VKRALLFALLAAGAMAGQEPAFDRKPSIPPVPQLIERRPEGSFAGLFRVGKTGEVWMIDTIRLWFLPPSGPGCGKELGDSVEKITLAGALDNPPVPGQPVCDCHALVPLATVAFDRGSSQPKNSAVKLAFEDGLSRIDFTQVRWSMPAAADALFQLRATPRAKSSCAVEAGWSLATAPAPPGFRLHLLDKKGIPAGLAAEESPRAIAIQVWGRTEPRP
jgi:hypothetical protein